MYLEIISPEKPLFKGEVKSVTVPGSVGEFQMLDHHAAILSTLVEGVVKFELEGNVDKDSMSESISINGNICSLKIKGGVVEMNKNVATILPS
jgi:F-type H+-transporting ATPase subunit epsilon